LSVVLAVDINRAAGYKKRYTQPSSDYAYVSFLN